VSERSIELRWQRSAPNLHSVKCSNAHTVRHYDNHELQVDAAPDRGGDPDITNSEQAPAAAVSSCHMMTFLALAEKTKWPVASFHDRAVAYLGKNARGKMSITQVDLHSVVGIDSGFSIDAAGMEEMQQRAHRIRKRELDDDVILRLALNDCRRRIE
jgi:organic hydroperoxide reductase OsmC/OhrA